MIPKNQHEAELLERIQNLEKSEFGGSKEEGYKKPQSARSEMTENEEGQNGLERDYLGTDSYDSLKAVLTSLGQDNSRNAKWNEKLQEVKVRLSKTDLDANQERNLIMLLQRVEAGVIRN